MAEQQNGGGVLGNVLEDLPTDELKEQARDLMTALGEHAMSVASDKVDGLTGRLMGFMANGSLKGSDSGSDSDSGPGGGSGGSPVKKLLKAGAGKAKDMVMDKLSGGGSKGGGGKAKTTDIIEQIEVGLPLRVVYDRWTQFQDFPSFTKRIESVEQESDEKVTWKAGIYFSHRSWKSTIVEQVPDERIVWRSQGDKGYVDGTVTFHEITPNLTKVLLVLEYHPQGLFERTGNAFRSQRRRARLELNKFDRHVMREIITEQDEVEGWRGEIRDGEVVRSHEDALEEEENEADENEAEENEAEESQDENENENDEYEDEYEEGEDEDEAGDEEEAGDEDEDEYEDEYEEEPEDEYEEEDEEEPEEDEEEPEEDDEVDEEAADDYEAEAEDEADDEDDEPRRKRSSRGRRRETAGSR